MKVLMSPIPLRGRAGKLRAAQCLFGLEWSRSSSGSLQASVWVVCTFLVCSVPAQLIIMSLSLSGARPSYRAQTM